MSEDEGKFFLQYKFRVEVIDKSHSKYPCKSIINFLHLYKTDWKLFFSETLFRSFPLVGVGKVEEFPKFDNGQFAMYLFVLTDTLINKYKIIAILVFLVKLYVNSSCQKV